MATANRTFAMPLAPAATFVKPKIPAITDAIKNMAAHLSMNYSIQWSLLKRFDCRQDNAVGGSTVLGARQAYVAIYSLFNPV
jgi:hypothetical protein